MITSKHEVVIDLDAVRHHLHDMVDCIVDAVVSKGSRYEDYDGPKKAMSRVVNALQTLKGFVKY